MNKLSKAMLTTWSAWQLTEFKILMPVLLYNPYLLWISSIFSSGKLCIFNSLLCFTGNQIHSALLDYLQKRDINLPYSWHIISIGPESCHQELWLVDIIPYYRRAPSKNIPSKRKWLRGQGLFCVGPFIIILYSVSPVVYEWHVENKKVTKINCTTWWI